MERALHPKYVQYVWAIIKESATYPLSKQIDKDDVGNEYITSIFSIKLNLRPETKMLLEVKDEKIIEEIRSLFLKNESNSILMESYKRMANQNIISLIERVIIDCKDNLNLVKSELGSYLYYKIENYLVFRSEYFFK